MSGKERAGVLQHYLATSHSGAEGVKEIVRSGMCGRGQGRGFTFHHLSQGFLTGEQVLQRRTSESASECLLTNDMSPCQGRHTEGEIQATTYFCVKALLQHSHDHSVLLCLWMLLKCWSRIDVTEMAWVTKSNRFTVWLSTAKSAMRCARYFLRVHY